MGPKKTPPRPKKKQIKPQAATPRSSPLVRPKVQPPQPQPTTSLIEEDSADEIISTFNYDDDTDAELSREPSVKFRIQPELQKLQATTDTKNKGTHQFCQNLLIFVREFSETIEIDGLLYLFEEGRTYCERLFWMFVELISFVAFILLTVIVHSIFLETPIIVSFSTKDMSTFEVPFPAVTICSQVKTVHGIQKFSEVYKKFKKGEKFANQEETNIFEYYHIVCEDSYVNDDSAYEKYLLDTLDDSFFDTLKKISPSVDDIMVKCSFLGQTYNCSTLFKPIYTDEGRCYSFNLVEWKELFAENVVYHPGFFEADFSGSDWTSRREFKDGNKIVTYPRRGYLSGATNSLIVKLKQAKVDVDPVCSKGILGFKVTLNDPLQLPTFKNYHIQISTNTSVIALIETDLMQASDVIKSLSSQTRQCYFSSERSLKFFRRYNQRNCLLECYANFTKDLCNCIPFFLPRDNKTQICGVLKIKCMNDAHHKFGEVTLQEDSRTLHSFMNTKCDCKPNCNELQYVTEISHSHWDWSDSFFNASELSKDHNYDISGFTLFFKNDHFLIRNRIEFNGVAELMANIGGLLNFFMGGSLLTLIEILYTFTIMILSNKFIYGPWAGPAAIQYEFED